MWRRNGEWFGNVRRISALLTAFVALAVLSCERSSTKSEHAPHGVGEVEVVVRTVRGVLVNQPMPRLLAVRDAVFWRERIETDRESFTEIELADGTKLSLGPDAKVTVDEFVYAPGPGGRLALNVTKGMMRFVTGTMSKEAYEIRAPGAIIGVRGTAFTLIVDAEEAVTTCLVHHGSVVVRDTDGAGSVVVMPGQSSVVRAKVIEPPTTPERPSEQVIKVVREMDEALSGGRLKATEVREARVDPSSFERRSPVNSNSGAPLPLKNRLFSSGDDNGGGDWEASTPGSAGAPEVKSGPAVAPAPAPVSPLAPTLPVETRSLPSSPSRL